MMYLLELLRFHLHSYLVRNGIQYHAHLGVMNPIYDDNYEKNCHAPVMMGFLNDFLPPVCSKFCWGLKWGKMTLLRQTKRGLVVSLCFTLLPNEFFILPSYCVWEPHILQIGTLGTKCLAYITLKKLKVIL
jgi:hypothetical protein